MVEDHPLKGCFKFENLPGEIVIEIKYKLQVKKDNMSDNERRYITDWRMWIDVETSEDLDYIYSVRDECWNDKVTRIVKIETSLWEDKNP
jgi:hypothetical protein